MLRRDLKIAGGLSAATTLLGPARAAMAPDDNYDLVIKGGDVIDPSQSLRGERDLGIIARDEAMRVAARARKTGR
ncbi:MAG: amidohydrolase [Tardiphaga sp.]|nr:amidohydrolase [Tardiphaga sp.]